MNKSESKYFNTAKKIDKAFLAILEKKEFEYITVKEICEKANVHRSTFYLHYETINDLLIETVDYINSTFKTYFQHLEVDLRNLKSLPIENLDFIQPKYLAPWLKFIQENKKIYQTILRHYDHLRMNDHYEPFVKKLLFPILERHGIKTDNKIYILLFYLEGLNGIVKEWIKQDCQKDIGELITIIINCIDGRK